MLLKTKARVLSRFLAAVTATSLLAACASSKPGGDPSTGRGTAAMPASCTKAGPVVFAISGRRDSPAPGLTPRMHTAAQEAVSQGSAIGVVNVDGAPKLIGTWSADTRNMNSGAAQPNWPPGKSAVWRVRDQQGVCRALL